MKMPRNRNTYFLLRKQYYRKLLERALCLVNRRVIAEIEDCRIIEKIEDRRSIAETEEVAVSELG
jgi:hypothetical protein